MSDPYQLGDDAAYQNWREAKLAVYPLSGNDCQVEIKDPHSLVESELEAILRACDQNNFVLYQLVEEEDDKSLVHDLGRQLGLERLDMNLRADEDSVTSLEVREQQGNQYIPYTNKALSWHCDGYYNELSEQVRGVILHCVNPAGTGGENGLIDHEMMYIRLRDEDEAYISALMQPDAMTIPANVEDGVELRPAQSGPVFSVDAATGKLHMRYSARKRNILWKQDDMTLAAADRITHYLNDESIIIRHRLQAGQGLISNNILHNRTAFDDDGDSQRLLYRARYFDRVMNSRG